MLRKASVIAAMLATTTAVAACGGSGSPTTKDTASVQPNNAALKLAKCIRTHGVPDFPDPQGGGGFGIQAAGSGANGAITVDGQTLNVSAPAFQRAMQECQKYQPGSADQRLPARQAQAGCAQDGR